MNPEWRVARAAELQADRVLLVQDGNHGEYRPRSDEFIDDGVAFVRAADVDDGAIRFDQVSRINEVALQRITKGIGQPGDTIVSHKGTVGRAAWARFDCEPFVCSPQTTFWRSTDWSRLDPRFLFSYLRSPLFQRQLAAHQGESDMAPYVSLTVQRTLSVAVPPIAEQRRIAGVLGALDDKIDHNRIMASRLLDASAAQVDHALVAVDQTVSIYGLATVTYGRAFKSELFGSAGTPLLRIRDLATHEPGVRTTEDLPKARLVTAGDIVVGMDGEFRAHLWHGADSLLNQRVCVFDPKPGVSRAYLWRGIQTPLAFVEGTEAGTTVIHLGKADIDDFELPKPVDEVLRTLLSTADPMIERAVQLGRETRTLAEFRDALLPKLVSGRIRVPESYDPGDFVDTLVEQASAS
jgi:type I restriction enzyme S subunit